VLFDAYQVTCLGISPGNSQYTMALLVCCNIHSIYSRVGYIHEELACNSPKTIVIHLEDLYLIDLADWGISLRINMILN